MGFTTADLKAAAAGSEGERLLAFQLRAAKLPTPEREVQFHPTRRWRFDFCWPELRVAAEVEGGTWIPDDKLRGGRHTRGKGFEDDCEKYNAAGLLGWTVLRFSTEMVTDGRALSMIEQVLKDRMGR